MSLARLLDPLAPPICVACRAHAGRGVPLCARCRAGLRWLDRRPVTLAGVDLWAPLAYEGPARSLVAALKFRGVLGVAQAMAAPIAACAPAGWLGEAVLVPVPLHPARRRRRGFNQAESITVALAERTGLGVSDCLERRGRGTTQVGRGRSQRARAIEGAVAVAPGTLVPPRPMLVDDVATTGATLASCEAALRAAGALSVRAMAYARTPGR